MLITIYFPLAWLIIPLFVKSPRQRGEKVRRNLLFCCLLSLFFRSDGQNTSQTNIQRDFLPGEQNRNCARGRIDILRLNFLNSFRRRTKKESSIDPRTKSLPLNFPSNFERPFIWPSVPIFGKTPDWQIDILRKRAGKSEPINRNEVPWIWWYKLVSLSIHSKAIKASFFGSYLRILIQRPFFPHGDG